MSSRTIPLPEAGAKQASQVNVSSRAHSRKVEYFFRHFARKPRSEFELAERASE